MSKTLILVLNRKPEVFKNVPTSYENSITFWSSLQTFWYDLQMAGFRTVSLLACKQKWSQYRTSDAERYTPYFCPLLPEDCPPCVKTKKSSSTEDGEVRMHYSFLKLVVQCPFVYIINLLFSWNAVQCSFFLLFSPWKEKENMYWMSQILFICSL